MNPIVITSSETNAWGSVADWFVAAGTLILAAVAVFQQTIRNWFYKPKLKVSIKTEPPDCHAVPLTRTDDGTFLADAVYLRIWVENEGNDTAKNVEVFAKELRRKRAEGKWERVSAFPSMNLKWSHVGLFFFPIIAPDMGKHCDIGHIVDPARRTLLPNEVAPKLNLESDQTSLTFDLISAPNHKGHIIGPGEYELDILVAAENAKPRKETLAIRLTGKWYADETKMLRDGVGASLV